MKRFLSLLLWLAPLCVSAQTDGWTIVARDTSGYVPAAMANGQLGLVVGRKPFEAGPLLLGSSYERGGRNSVSRILEGICPLGLSMGETGPIRTWKQEIDMRQAMHVTRFATDAVAVVCRIRALRNMPYAVMAEVEVEALRDTTVQFVNRHAVPVGLTDTLRENRTVWCEDGGRKVQRTEGGYNNGADHVAATSVFLCGKGFELLVADRVEAKLRRGERASFALVGVVCTTADFSDPWNESERQAIYAAREGTGTLIAVHEKQWADLWRSDIIVEGDAEIQRNVRFALFNLYSSIREGSHRSIAPMGLTSQDYNGHIFWDAETWIFPPLLVLHPHLARQMLDYRADRLEQARRRAYAHGYRGAMFPWESDDRGEESTPTFALTGPLEHHITADVAIAAWQYYCVTRDREWLCRTGYPMMRECARFWCDRATRNDDGSYSIRNVVGADEYAIGVTDNAFTNGAVRRALESTAKAAEACGEHPDPQWSAIAAGLRIPRFLDGTTREHADYNGEQIKQADANLLGYPLGIVADSESLLRDLAYYEARIDPENGPAMSHSVFAIQYARLGMTEKAMEMFRHCYEPNLRPPFGVFAETSASDNPYFLTGVGGMLQAVLFGFSGIEITDDGIVQRETRLPHGWKRLAILKDYIANE